MSAKPLSAAESDEIRFGQGDGMTPGGGPDWEGSTNRDCGDHRSVGSRAWCYADSEWCYEEAPCRGCELPALRERFAAAEARIADLTAEGGAAVTARDGFAESLAERGGHVQRAEARIAKLAAVAEAARHFLEHGSRWEASVLRSALADLDRDAGGEAG